MRFLLRILTIPVVLILSLMKLILDGAAKVYCLVAGVAINLLVICAVLAVVTGQWFAAVVFGIIFVSIIVILICVGATLAILDNLKERLWRY